MAALIESERELVRQQITQQSSRIPERHNSPSILPNKRELTQGAALSQANEDDQASLYLTPEEVSSRWRDRVTSETLANWRSLQIGPPYHKFGKAVLYRADLLAQWERQYLFVCDSIKISPATDGADPA